MGVGLCRAKFSFIYHWSKQRFYYMVLCYKSLAYNSFDSTAEALFEPVFFIVDFALRWFGVGFVATVTLLITSVVVIFYLYILPIVLETHSSLYAYIHLLYGHYLLMMIVFHYFKAVTTEPGTPPSMLDGTPITCVCKRCFLPKPPRTHHCNICNTCQLKMDHHCPWLNNCVGHFNHRYFLSFCVFMCLGTIYVSCSSHNIFKDCFHLEDKLKNTKETMFSVFGQQSNNLFNQSMSEYVRDNMCLGKPRSYNTSIVYLWILCSSVTVALGCLTAWHIILISCGETSIERLINRKERKRMKHARQRFVNPYDFGVIQNWKSFLGFRDPRSFFFKVVLPSTHYPIGNGIAWKTIRRRNSFVA